MDKDKIPVTMETDTPVRLRKHLGLVNGVGIIVGIIIGSGIFVSPKGVIMESGSVGACILVWGLCGLFCMIGALSYAELGTCIPSSGADYVYLQESLGDFSAFLHLWVTLMVIAPAENAIIALTFASYMIQPFFPDCGAPKNAVALVAALCICLLTYINCRNVKWAIQVQDTFTCTKVVALVVIIVVGMVKIAMGYTDNFYQPFEGTTTDPGKISLAFYSGLFSYSGWTCLNNVTEEMKDPHKNLPRAIFMSIPIVTVIYILTNVAYFAVLTPAEIIASDAVAVTFADRTLNVMSWTMSALVALSTFGSLNGIIFTLSRTYFVGARNGHLPGFLATIKLENMTPLPSLLLGSLIAMLWLCSSDVITLINYASFADAVFKSLVVVGLIVLRVTRPNMKRPIKVNLIFHVLFLILCAFLIVTPLLTNPMECFMGVVMITTGIPVYLIGVKWKRKPEWFNVALKSCSNFVQKLFTAVHEEPQND